jgi:hypothetical protein
MVSRQWGRPFAEHLNKPTTSQVLADLIEREVGEPKPIDGGVKDQIDGVENERPVHADADLAPILKKPPPVQRT